MATLALQAAGQAVGGLLGPFGAIVGRAAGALAGNIIDQRLFGESSTRVVGYMEDLSVQTASDGSPVARVYGRMRLAGTVIWARDFEESVEVESAGKGSGSTVAEFSYTASFAVGICEGPIARVARVWADGEPLDLDVVNARIYLGRGHQPADPLIEALEGDTSAFRNTAYIVFEKLPVGPYGNRLPRLTFEVVRPVGRLEEMVRAVTMIPGATEFGYHAERVDRTLGPGEAAADNRHLDVAASDIEASLDELTAVCPNVESVALVVAWFGDNLDCAQCTLQPAVESNERETSVEWGVAGESRATARLVSKDSDLRPTYGGTPADEAVFSAIKAIKARGLKVVFYPFILMDLPEGNGKTDPYGGVEQAPHPWRGRVTVSPAPGQTGSPDGSAAADAAVSALVGTAAPGDFSGSEAVVTYTGPAEWTLRRMVLHYAALTAQAGGVDAFLVGSELRGLTTIRGASGFPFVDALSGLVDDVRSIVGAGTKISYAADWSEYFGHQPAGGDVSFHLDPVWANPNVDFIAIDNYWPLSDWRDGSHADEALAEHVHDTAYLAGNVAGGEGYDWYYASDQDRVAQVRSPISDGAYGKDWVFRYKDLANWWSNLHYDRVAGVEVAQPTAWVPRSKPVWFTEVGCPAVDRGSNQPNVFYDPKSSESKLPYFSRGLRDDAIQRAYLEAMLGAFDPATSSDIDAINPSSSVYGGRMVDHSMVHVWTWDARPWPAFPLRTDVWSDGANWERGHWLSGRMGGAPLGELIEALFDDWGLTRPEIVGLSTALDGFIVPSSNSLRQVLEPLLLATTTMGADTGTGVRFVSLDRGKVGTFNGDVLVETGDTAPMTAETREEEASLPVEQRLRFYDSGRDYQTGAARFRPAEGTTRQIDEIAVSASLNNGLAAQLSQVALSAKWAGRTRLQFALPQSDLALLPGDIVGLTVDGREREAVIEEVEDLTHRAVSARTVDRAALVPTYVPGSGTPPVVTPVTGVPVAFGLNLPLVDETVSEHVPWIGIYANPWPGTMGVWRAAAGGAFDLVRTVGMPASMGAVVAPPAPGPTSRWDYGARLDVRLYGREVRSRAEIDVLGGKNAIAVEAANGGFEIVQFQDAELVGEDTYRLTGLLRGQAGTEDAAASGILVGARLAILDGTLSTLQTPLSEVGLERTYRVGLFSEGIGGRSVTTFTFTPAGRGLVPYGPVHGAGLRQSNGAVVITWVRRTRVGGDPWPDSGDVPLGETAELYRLEILDQGAVVRTVEIGAPTYTYSLANQTADFGAAQNTLSIRVAQLAPGFGTGVAYEVTFDVQQP